MITTSLTPFQKSVIRLVLCHLDLPEPVLDFEVRCGLVAPIAWPQQKLMILQYLRTRGANKALWQLANKSRWGFVCLSEGMMCASPNEAIRLVRQMMAEDKP